MQLAAQLAFSPALDVDALVQGEADEVERLVDGGHGCGCGVGWVWCGVWGVGGWWIRWGWMRLSKETRPRGAFTSRTRRLRA